MVKPHAIPTQPTADMQSTSFASAALGMGWQLAVVVLLPIFGGYKLDQSTNTVPLWTLVGLCIAMLGSVIVIRRALQNFGNFNVGSAEQPKAINDKNKDDAR